MFGFACLLPTLLASSFYKEQDAVLINSETQAAAKATQASYKPSFEHYPLQKHYGVVAPYQCTYYCGNQSPAGCWCDERCYQNQDCCLGYAETCLNNDLHYEYSSRDYAPVPSEPQGLPADGTGMTYYDGPDSWYGDKEWSQTFCSGLCGSSSFIEETGQECFCDHTCHMAGDCCPDKEQNCGPNPYGYSPNYNEASYHDVMYGNSNYNSGYNYNYGSSNYGSSYSNNYGSNYNYGYYYSSGPSRLGEANYGNRNMMPNMEYSGQTGGTSNNAATQGLAAVTWDSRAMPKKPYDPWASYSG